MEIKIIHTADLHLGRALPYLTERAAQRRSEVTLTLQRITELCTAQNAAALLIAGDLFESPRPDVSLATQVFKILENAKIPVIIAAGNHDCLLSDSPYFTQTLPENVTLLTNKTPYVKICEGVTVYGASFTDYEMLCPSPLTAPDVNDINVLLLHADIDTESRYNPINTAWLAASGADYAALGHIHKRCEPRMAGNTLYAYSGCPEGQGFDELSVCGVYSVTLKKGGCTAEFIPTCRRQHIAEKIDISECTDNLAVCKLCIEQIKEKYGEQYAGNLYKIYLTGYLAPEFKPDTAFICENLSTELYYVKASDKTLPRIDYKLLAKEPTLKGIFVRRMLEHIQEDTANAPLYEAALNIGIKAFDGEVEFNED